jgi:putative acetyltransferase
MIRKWQSENTAPLLSLWLESTTVAHPFIEASYWKENEAMVRDVYLPSAETWVWEQDGEPCGFISVMQSQFFYHAQGFRIEDSAWQDDTQHPTWIMSWQADQTPLR